MQIYNINSDTSDYLHNLYVLCILKIEMNTSYYKFLFKILSVDTL